MDLGKEIADLKAKCSALEQQLAAPGISENERHDINQRIVALINLITAILTRVTIAMPAPPSVEDSVVIPVKMEIGHPLNNKRLPYYAFDAIVDSRFHDTLLLSEKTWAHVVEHFGDMVTTCNKCVMLTDGTIVTLTASAVLAVRVQMNDGSWVEARMGAYKSDRDVLGRTGHESLGLLVDAPNRCLKRAIMLIGAVQPSGMDVRDASAVPAHRFLPKTLGHPVCKVCGKRWFEHDTM